MPSIDRARLAFVASLLVLGVSVAGFVTATDVAVATDDVAASFAVEGGALTVATAHDDAALVGDVGAHDRIEIAREDRRFVVTAAPREPPTLDADLRERARRTAVTNETIADRLADADTAAIAVHPLAAGSNAPGPVVPRPPADDPGPRNATVEASTRSGAVVIEPAARAVDDERVLVIVDPVADPVEFRVVVDVDRRTVDSIVRLERVAERPARTGRDVTRR